MNLVIQFLKESTNYLPVQLLVEAGDDVGDGGGWLLGPEHVQVVDALEHVVMDRGALLVSPAQTTLE